MDYSKDIVGNTANLSIAQGSGHCKTTGPNPQGPHRASLHSAGAQLAPKLRQALLLYLVVIQPVVAAHLHS